MAEVLRMWRPRAGRPATRTDRQDGDSGKQQQGPDPCASMTTRQVQANRSSTQCDFSRNSTKR